MTKLTDLRRLPYTKDLRVSRNANGSNTTEHRRVLLRRGEDSVLGVETK